MAQAMDTVTVTGGEVRAVSPEGVEASMKLTDLLERLAPQRIDTGEIILPEGVKAVLPGKSGLVMVHQTAPRVYSFKWIREDSPEGYGEAATYRTVKIGLPYLVVFASFERGPMGGLEIQSGSECFFSNGPIKSLGDELAYPALLNCSKFEETSAKPLSWICVQHLPQRGKRGAIAPPDLGRHLAGSLKDLLSHLLETGFNYSSEHHEGASWFSATVEAGVDPRVSSVEAWEAATAEDPLFVLDVPWIPTGKSVGEIARRVGSRQSGCTPRIRSGADLARLVFHEAGGGAEEQFKQEMKKRMEDQLEIQLEKQVNS